MSPYAAAFLYFTKGIKMSTGFKKFKSGITFGISFKCLAFSLSLGLCVAAFLLLFSKLELISVSSPLLIIAPVTSSLVLFGVLFLFANSDTKYSHIMFLGLGC